MRPGAFGLFFDCPPTLGFLDPQTGQPREGALLDGGIAVLTITGPLEHQESWWWASYHAIRRELETALSWPGVEAVTMKLDTPGGVCAGMLACHRAIRELRAKYGKPVVAFVDELAASAGYGLASACDEIWLPPEGVVGSIGVILCTIDESKRLEKEGIAVRYVVTGNRKADMQPGARITDEVLAVAQEKVDELGALFFEAVGKSRGMKAEEVEVLEAAVFMGESAVAAGLADGVADWPAFLGTLRRSLGASVGTTGTTAQPKVIPMQTRMQATKTKNDAEAAVRVAQSAVAVAKGDALPKAMAALTDALAADKAAGEALAKVTHYRKLEEKTVESPEKAADSAPMSAAPETQPSKDPEAMNSASDMPASGEDEDEEAKGAKALAKAFAAGSQSLKGAGHGALMHYGPAAVLSLCEKALGVKGPRAVVGALGALPERLAAATKLEGRLAKLEGESRTEKVNALVAQAKADGRTLGADHRAKLRAFGAKHGVEELRGMIAMLPKAMRTVSDGQLEAREGDDGRGQFTEAEDAEKEKLLATLTAGMSAEDKAQFEKDFAANLAAKGPKVPKV